MAFKDIYYTIGQVADHVDLPQSVLRYWETVFDVLNPHKSKGGNRRYSEQDIEIILKIKELLYDQGFTIKGANKQLKALYGLKSSEDEQREADKKQRQGMEPQGHDSHISNEKTGSSFDKAQDEAQDDKWPRGQSSHSAKENTLKTIQKRIHEIIKILDER